MDAQWIKKNAEYTGKCGDGLFWWRAGNDLYIEGQGEIDEYAFAGYSYQNVKIASGCTEIGDYAFTCCHLECVELPDGLTRIGKGAFEWAYALSCLTVPQSVTEIGKDAFGGIDEIVYNGLACPEWLGEQWGARKWSYDPVLRFRNAICSERNDTPPEIEHREGIEGSRMNAYDRCVSWNGQLISGTEVDMCVEPPFCCAIGGLFWAVCDYDGFQFVEAKLLSVLEWHEKSAKVRVLILQTKDMLSTIEPVSEEIKEKLRNQHTYDYYAPAASAFNRSLWERKQNLIHIYNSYGEGDSLEIYTDKDGIDHWVWWEESDHKDGCVFVQDKILGFRVDSPYQWENELFIDRKWKKVLACRREAKAVVVPDGINTLGWQSFMNCPDLEQVTIPASVRNTRNAFPEYVIGTARQDGLKNLKRIILKGDSKLSESDFPKNAAIIRIP